MTFQPIKRQSRSASKVPDEGIRVAPCGPRSHRSIALLVGKGLAHHLAWTDRELPVTVAVGKDEDTGRLALMAQLSGAFIARRRPDGSFRITVSEAHSEGALSREFEPFTVDFAEVRLSRRPAEPHVAILRVPADFLMMEGQAVRLPFAQAAG